MTKENQLIGGHLLVQKEIGRGSVGRVLLVRNKYAGTMPYACKLLANPEAREIFFEEVRLLSKVQHPCFVRLEGFGNDGSPRQPYVLLELCDGVQSKDEVVDSTSVVCNSTKGYNGTICGICLDGFTRKGNLCIPCPTQEVSFVGLFGAGLALYVFLVYNALHTSGEESDTSALTRILVSFLTVSAYVGEFKIRGTEMFQAFISVFVQLASALDIGFVPVVCAKKLTFGNIFFVKMVMPYVVIVFVGLGIFVVLRCCRQGRALPATLPPAGPSRTRQWRRSACQAAR